MKKIFLSVFCLLFVLNINCTIDPHKVEGQFVKLKDGRIMQFRHNIGDTYFLYEIDTAQIQLKGL